MNILNQTKAALAVPTLDFRDSMNIYSHLKVTFVMPKFVIIARICNACPNF